ncbi:MAG: diaminopimelate dehydrogenase [Defluviitaleaceae bacterium]|nr:diaminopimelate dehydrogenase [Defluviitaleaceae bacterium]
MEKINIIVVGYGNIGKYAVEAVLESPDMNLLGIVSNSLSSSGIKEKDGIRVAADAAEFETKPDVAILCSPTRSIPEIAPLYLSKGIHTVDSYDAHDSIWELKMKLSPVAEANNAVSIISSGWDPGSDSVVRALLLACAPNGVTYTNFGPGMSMGHSVAVKAIDGVSDALSVTIPLGTGIHRRAVYISLEQGADFTKISEAIKKDPYFKNDETHIFEVDDISKLLDVGHGVSMSRKGVSGKTHNQMFEFNMRINNPALTSQIMISCARACMRQKPGAYTMIEVPVANLLPGSLEENVRKLV